MRSLFAHPSVAASAAAFLDGLLGPERRKTGWMRAEAAGDPGPWRQQAVLGRSHWDADALRDMVRDYALETLASPDAVLVLDETGFLKQGQSSCGVGRQYTGSAGKIANCQIGVFAAYVSHKGCAFIDRQLYLPKDWTNEARAPDRGSGARRHPLCHQTRDRRADDRAGARGRRAVHVGGGRHGLWRRWLEMQLRRAGKGYVLGAHATDQFNSWDKSPPVAGTAAQIARACPRDLEAPVGRDGTKGPRLYDWAYVELADLEAGGIQRGLTDCGRAAC